MPELEGITSLTTAVQRAKAVKIIQRENLGEKGKYGKFFGKSKKTSEKEKLNVENQKRKGEKKINNKKRRSFIKPMQGNAGLAGRPDISE